MVLPNKVLRASPVHLSESQQVRLRRRFPGVRWRDAAETLEVPFPREGVEDLVAWVAATLRDILAPPKQG